MIYGVIMAGGTGSRLNPISTEDFPKQFLSVVYSNGYSLYQNTILRNLNKVDGFIVVGSLHNRPLLEAQTSIISKFIKDKPVKLLYEESGRGTLNTLLSVLKYIDGVKSFQFFEDDLVRITDNDSLILFPADHYFSGDYEEVFNIHRKINNTLYLYGYRIKNPEYNENYGYIFGRKDGSRVFLEKPSKAKFEITEKNSCNTYINMGIFLAKISSLNIFTEDFNKDDIHIEKIKNTKGKYVIRNKNCKVLNSIDKEIVQKLPFNSINMVDTSGVYWADLGNLSSYFSNHGLEKSYTDIGGKLLSTEDDRISVLIQNDNVIIKTFEQSSNKESFFITNISEKAVNSNLNLGLRAWGSFLDITQDNKKRLKLLFIDPGKRISLQLHNNRSENWLIIKGVAYATKGSKINSLQNVILKKDDNFNVPVGYIHQITNISNDTLVIFEIQDFINPSFEDSEEDIIRILDDRII